MNKNKKILKVLLYFSCLPYILFIVFSITGIFTGYRLMFGTGYGLNAFLGYLIWSILYGFASWFLPVCMSYQLFYYFSKKGREKTSKVFLIISAISAIFSLPHIYNLIYALIHY